jgi:hypothetical protein
MPARYTASGTPVGEDGVAVGASIALHWATGNGRRYRAGWCSTLIPAGLRYCEQPALRDKSCLATGNNCILAGSQNG